jgi:septal ring factor EnvC (AmiA/AmiB activator)
LRLDEQNKLLSEMLDQRTTLLADLGLEQQELARLVRSAYMLGYPSRLKLMLNQDDLSGLSRNLAYYRYFNRARLEQIDSIRNRLGELEQLEQSINDERLQLESLHSEQAIEFERQDLARAERQKIAGMLAQRIDQDQKQLEEMLNNRRDLEILLERLSEILVDIPAGLGQNLVLSEHKGQLPQPLEGRILYAFGNQRAGGLRWQGWLYSVEAGTEVRSIAYGRIAFSDWLRGYGLLMIIDHGDGFMSLYGHNDSLLRDVGDWVQTGELISLSGASGGLARNGLYFEMRKDGKALDPSEWISR